MALTLELAQTVAVGPFNPHIITPEWLVKWNVVPDQEAEFRLGVLADGAAFRFGKVEWQVDDRRLMVSTPTFTDDCGALVAKVLDLLPHTPVRAVGHNFHFLCKSRQEWGNSPLPALGEKDLGEVPQLEQSRWTGIFRHDGVRVELTVVDAEDGVVVLLNHHRVTNNIDDAKAAAQQFRQDCEVSLGLLRDLLNQEITDA